MTKPRLRLTLAATMALVAIVAYLLARFIVPAHIQRDAAAAVVRAGGTVVYDWQLAGGDMYRVKPKPRQPRWLREAAGPDLFDTAKRVDLTARSVGAPAPVVDDPLMSQVARLEAVDILQLTLPKPPGLTAAGMAEIRRMKRLMEFDVFGGGDATGFIPHLGGMAMLRYLTLESVSPTEADMVTIASLPSLEALYIDGTTLTEAGLMRLRGSKTLRQLHLMGSLPRVTREGLRRLEGAMPGVAVRVYGRLAN